MPSYPYINTNVPLPITRIINHNLAFIISVVADTSFYMMYSDQLPAYPPLTVGAIQIEWSGLRGWGVGVTDLFIVIPTL